jgi:hypothetical protein
MVTDFSSWYISIPEGPVLYVVYSEILFAARGLIQTTKQASVAVKGKGKVVPVL